VPVARADSGGAGVVSNAVGRDFAAVSLQDSGTMWFKIVGEIRDIEPIALGRSVRVRVRLRKLYGGVRWRELQGIAEVRLPNGTRRLAEVHWYESHGVGRKEFEIKRFVKA
jgi:hypothetical protein